MFVCPLCKNKLRKFSSSKGDYLSCQKDICKLYEYKYTFENKVLNLIPFDLDLCVLKKSSEKNNSNFGLKLRKLDIFRRKLRSISTKIFKGANKKTIRNFNYLKNSIRNDSKVLVIGGGNIGYGMQGFYKKCIETNVEFHSIDVYFSDNVTLIADAHYLPFQKDYFDIVIIQAVLEHVISPVKVVSEIYRVLSEKGLVYSETPFLQPVHEGPYDFIRFTNSGHRWLFRKFDEIDSGCHQGAFQSMLYVSSYAVSALFRNRLVGIFIRLLFGRIARILDCFLKNESNIDIAAGNFFMGYKNQNKASHDQSKWIIDYYKGNQK